MKTSLRKLAIGLFLFGFGTFGGNSLFAAGLPEIKLPKGFRIEVYAEGTEGARSLALGGPGVVYVSSRKKGVYALKDIGKGVQAFMMVEGLNTPNGIAWRDGDLYVAETDRILRYPGIEKDLARPPMPQVVRADLPAKSHHGARYIAFGPDGKLYLAIGAPCNVCEPDRFASGGNDLETASITRMNADGSHWETVARGVRNSVGFDWHPRTHELWFTDNGRDLMGDDLPSCELNRLRTAGAHFGFPYCHQGDTPDDKFTAKACKDFVPPAAKLGAHVAPLGMRFYTGTMFPPEYRGQVFVARHGSWNRSSKVGYDVVAVKLDKAGRVTGQEVFASGWLRDEKSSGRPVDLLVMPDGALLVSDDQGGRVWRISYQSSPP